MASLACPEGIDHCIFISLVGLLSQIRESGPISSQQTQYDMFIPEKSRKKIINPILWFMNLKVSMKNSGQIRKI